MSRMKGTRSVEESLVLLRGQAGEKREDKPRSQKQGLLFPLPAEARSQNLSERLLLLEAVTAQLVCERSRRVLLQKASLLRLAVPHIEKYVVMLNDRPGGQLVAVSGDLSPEHLASLTEPEILPLWTHLLDRGQMFLVPDLATSRRFAPLQPLFHGEGVGSLWWIPLYDIEGTFGGALLYGFEDAYEPSPDDKTIACLFASHMGMALRQQQLLDQLSAKTREAEALLEDNQRSLEELSLAHRVSETALSTVRLDELLQRLTRVLCETMRASSGAAFLENTEGNLAQMAYYDGRGCSGTGNEGAAGATARYFFSEEGVRARFIPDLKDCPDAQGLLPNEEEGSLLLCPLEAQGRVAGFLAIGNPVLPVVGPHRDELLDTLCMEMSQGIENCYAHQTILRAQQELEAIFHGAGSGILVLDRDRRVKMWNAAAAMILDRPGLDLQGRSCWEVFPCLPHGESGKVCREGGEPASSGGCFISNGQPVTDLDWTLIGRGGATIDINLSSFPLASSPGMEESTILILRDVSSRRAVERMKTEFISTISHDLRTPLTAIKGYVSTIIDLGQDLGDEDRIRYLNGIAKATNRLVRLVEDILNVSRIEQGRLLLDRSLTPVDDLILSVVEEMQGQSTSHIIRLNLGKTLPELNIDAKKMEQVLINLLDNAVKYSPSARTIEVDARLVKKREELDVFWDPERGRMPSIPFPNVAVSVRDWGVGIAKEKQAALFTKFHRISSDTQPYRSGVGLGLYICKAMVEAHGGTIWVKSAPGRGSTFTFCLPVRQAEGPFRALKKHG